MQTDKIFQDNQTAKNFCRDLTDLCNTHKVELVAGQDGLLVLSIKNNSQSWNKKSLYDAERQSCGEYIVRSYLEK